MPAGETAGVAGICLSLCLTLARGFPPLAGSSYVELVPYTSQTSKAPRFKIYRSASISDQVQASSAAITAANTWSVPVLS